VTATRVMRLPRPGRHQLPILLSDARFKVVVAGRRFGKTLLGLLAATIGHGPRQRPFAGAIQGGNVWWVAPSYGIASKIWRDLKAAVRGWPDLAKNEVEHRIEFPAGGSITVKSAHDPDALRGEGLDGLVIDEAAFCPEAAWTLALRPALADRQGWAIFISTPAGTNWFHELFKKGGTENGWRSWQRPTSDNPTVPASELVAARTSLGSFAFAREFEAQFVTAAGSGLFRRESIQFYDLTDLPRAPLVRFATADLAVSTKTWADYTALVHLGRAQDGRLFVLDVFRERVDGAELVPTLAALLARWGAGRLVIEAGGPLSAVNAQARAHGLPVIELSTGNRDKVTRATPLAGAIEAGRVLFPRSAPWLETVLGELYAFPDPSAHDDVVDALALGVAAAPPFQTPAPTRRRTTSPTSRPIRTRY